jgi:hypothetical protein
MISARELVGKTITGFEPGAFKDPGGGIRHDPRIKLSDGTHLYFYAEELSNGADYGIFIGRTKPL